jgi:hypothetical protein
MDGIIIFIIIGIIIFFALLSISMFMIIPCHKLKNRNLKFKQPLSFKRQTPSDEQSSYNQLKLVHQATHSNGQNLKIKQTSFIQEDPSVSPIENLKIKQNINPNLLKSTNVSNIYDDEDGVIQTFNYNIIDGLYMNEYIYLITKDNKVIEIDKDRSVNMYQINANLIKLLYFNSQVYLLAEYNDKIKLYKYANNKMIDSEINENILNINSTPDGKYLYINGKLYNTALELVRLYDNKNRIFYDPDTYILRNEKLLYKNNKKTEFQIPDFNDIIFTQGGNIHITKTYNKIFNIGENIFSIS